MTVITFHHPPIPCFAISLGYIYIWVCLKIAYPYTQWLMTIIPIEWLFHWEYTLFSDKPIYMGFNFSPRCIGGCQYSIGEYSEIISVHRNPIQFRCLGHIRNISPVVPWGSNRPKNPVTLLKIDG